MAAGFSSSGLAAFGCSSFFLNSKTLHISNPETCKTFLYVILIRKYFVCKKYNNNVFLKYVLKKPVVFYPNTLRDETSILMRLGYKASSQVSGQSQQWGSGRTGNKW